MSQCPDESLKRAIFDGLKHGVDIGCHGLLNGGIFGNWPSVNVHAEKVDITISDNLCLGRLVGPWASPPCDQFISSPLGAFVRSGGSKVRLIHDLSFPPGRSVNDAIDPESFKLHYKTIDDAIGMCMSYEEPCFLAKSDLRSAFNHILINPKFWHLLGFEWRGLYYASAVLPFGLRSSPYLFDQFARGLEYMCISRGASRTTLHYLDDTLTASRNAIECARSIQIINDTARAAGFDLQPDKCTEPSQSIEFLGIQLNTVTRTLSITETRLQEILGLLDTWTGKKRCTKRELLSLIGKLSFVSRVIRSGRTFLRRLIDLSTKVKYLHYRINLNKQAQADIEWWKSCISSHNGVCMFPEYWLTNDYVTIYTDASNVALGVVNNLKWTMVPFIGDKRWLCNTPIHFREMLAVCVALETHALSLVNRKVLLMVDNQAIVYAINKGSIKCNKTMELVRSLYFVMCKHNIDCRSEYIATNENTLADSLSRMDFTLFRQCHPEAERHMTPPGDVKYFDIFI